MATAAADDFVVDPKRDRLVIVASSLGTVFEWYDFFIYGTLAAIIGRLFFPAGNETLQFLLALGTPRCRETNHSHPAAGMCNGFEVR